MEKILQITSGNGPVECCWAVNQIFKQMIKEAQDSDLKVSVMQEVKGIINDTLSSVTIKIEGNETGLNKFSASWLGSILWIAKSQFRKNHKRKNWYVAVNELKMIKESITVKDADIKYEAIRSSGPGGQHVNKVSSAVRAYHIPTGKIVLVSDSRSQIQNKKIAKQRLIDFLEAEQLEFISKEEKDNWSKHKTLERGNPVRVYKGYHFQTQ